MRKTSGSVSVNICNLKKTVKGRLRDLMPPIGISREFNITVHFSQDDMDLDIPFFWFVFVWPTDWIKKINKPENILIYSISIWTIYIIINTIYLSDMPINITFFPLSDMSMNVTRSFQLQWMCCQRIVPRERLWAGTVGVVCHPHRHRPG